MTGAALRSVYRILSLGLFGSLLLALGGCGPPSGQVAGKVTFKGQPAAGAELKFQSASNADEQFSGIAGDDGAYVLSYRTLEGLPPGRYNVTITHFTLPGGKPLPAGEAGEVLKSAEKAVKANYVFEQEIVAGPNSIDFELTKGQKQANQNPPSGSPGSITP